MSCARDEISTILCYCGGLAEMESRTSSGGAEAYYCCEALRVLSKFDGVNASTWKSESASGLRGLSSLSWLFASLNMGEYGGLKALPSFSKGV